MYLEKSCIGHVFKGLLLPFEFIVIEYFFVVLCFSFSLLVFVVGCFSNMDSKKCKPSKGVASSMNVVPLSVPKQEDEMARSLKDMVAVKSNVDIDLREVYFLILHFLSAGPCQRSFVQLRNELLEHRLLPRRYHAWFSRSGEPGEDDADDDDGISLPLDYNNLMDRYFLLSFYCCK